MHGYVDIDKFKAEVGVENSTMMVDEMVAHMQQMMLTLLNAKNGSKEIRQPAGSSSPAYRGLGPTGLEVPRILSSLLSLQIRAPRTET